MSIEQVFRDGELPEGWMLSTLGDVCSHITDGTHKTPAYAVNGIRFLSTANLVPFRAGFDFAEYERFISNGDHEQLIKRCKPERGDVLVSKCGTIGRTKEVDVDFPFSIFVGLALIKPLRGLFASAFLEAFLNSPEMQSQFDELSPGSTRRTLTLGGLKSAQVPVPPLAEQERIVERIASLITRTSSINNRISRVPPILKRFRQAVLATACSGRLTEGWRVQELSTSSGESSADWPTSSVNDVCSVIVDCPHSTPKWTESGVICLRTTNFKAGALDLSEVRYVSESTYTERTNRLVPKAGDVLYSREGGILGIACIVPPGVRLCLGQRMMLMRTDRNICDPAFLMHTLNSPETVGRVRSLTGGSASPHLNVADIKKFSVLLPTLSKQRAIVRRVEALFGQANVIERHVATTRLHSNRLTQSILAKAFRGELVPTEAELARCEGRDYETASVLLERIKKEHATEPKSAKCDRKSVLTAASG